MVLLTVSGQSFSSNGSGRPAQTLSIAGRLEKQIAWRILSKTTPRRRVWVDAKRKNEKRLDGEVQPLCLGGDYE